MRTQSQMMEAVKTACADINRRNESIRVGVDWNGIIRFSTLDKAWDIYRSVCHIHDIPRAFSIEEIVEWIETELAVAILSGGPT